MHANSAAPNPLPVAIDLDDATPDLKDLVMRAEAGQEILLIRNGVVVARISGVVRKKQPIPSLAEFRATMPRMRTSSSSLIRRLRNER